MTDVRRNHHYVPQFYLRYFASRQKAENYFVRVYTRDRESYETNIKNIASERGLYTVPDKETLEDSDMIEDMFSEIESRHAPIWDKIAKGDIGLSEEDRAEIDYFFAFLFTRTVNFREYQKEQDRFARKSLIRSLAMDKERFKRVLDKAGAKAADEKQIEEARAAALDFDKHFKIEIKGGDSSYTKAFLELALELVPVFQRKHFYLMRAKGKQVFITCDNPVVLLPFDRMYRKGLEFSLVAIPISPKMCLLLDKGQRKKSDFGVSDEMVDKINKCIMFYARSYIFTSLESKSIANTFAQSKAQETIFHTFDSSDSSLLVSSMDTPPCLAGDIFRS